MAARRESLARHSTRVKRDALHTQCPRQTRSVDLEKLLRQVSSGSHRRVESGLFCTPLRFEETTRRRRGHRRQGLTGPDRFRSSPHGIRDRTVKSSRRRPAIHRAQRSIAIPRAHSGRLHHAERRPQHVAAARDDRRRVPIAAARSSGPRSSPAASCGRASPAAGCDRPACRPRTTAPAGSTTRAAPPTPSPASARRRCATRQPRPRTGAPASNSAGDRRFRASRRPTATTVAAHRPSRARRAAARTPRPSTRRGAPRMMS